MRPVNLIPPEDRRGDRAPLRAGSLSYVIVGGIAAVLVAVVALVLTQNGITENENEIAQLEVARDAAAARAEALAPYAEFATLQQQRETTIATLAQSRFDWERVLRELALVIPGDITLDSLEAMTAGSGSDPAAAAASAASIAGPSLVMTGCGPSHDSVATFVAALKDIDGVTRVGLDNSIREGDAEGAASSEGGVGDAVTAANCGRGTTTFSVTAAFDGVTVAAPVDASGAAPAAPVDASGAAPDASAAPAAPAETNSQAEQVEQAQNATNVVPGAVR